MKAVASRFGAGRILSASRAIACVAVGVVAGVAVTLLWTGALAPLVGWCTAAGMALAWVWLISWHQDAEGTKRLAEDEHRSASTDLWVVSAAVASLVAVGVGLRRPSGTDPLAVATVLLCRRERDPCVGDGQHCVRAQVCAAVLPRRTRSAWRSTSTRTPSPPTPTSPTWPSPLAWPSPHRGETQRPGDAQGHAGSRALVLPVRHRGHCRRGQSDHQPLGLARTRRRRDRKGRADRGNPG